MRVAYMLDSIKMITWKGGGIRRGKTGSLSWGNRVGDSYTIHYKNGKKEVVHK